LTTCIVEALLEHEQLLVDDLRVQLKLDSM